MKRLLASILAAGALGTGLGNQGGGASAATACSAPTAVLDRHQAIVRRGFSRRRWVDRSPLRPGEREDLARLHRCASGEMLATMRRARRRAKARFHRYFHRLIDPPGRAYLNAVGACESSGNYATNTGNGFFGKYQFDLRTWGSVGGRGLPSSAPPREQDVRAARLHRERGASPWPRCG